MGIFALDTFHTWYHYRISDLILAETHNLMEYFTSEVLCSRSLNKKHVTACASTLSAILCHFHEIVNIQTSPCYLEKVVAVITMAMQHLIILFHSDHVLSRLTVKILSPLLHFVLIVFRIISRFLEEYMIFLLPVISSTFVCINGTLTSNLC